MHRFAFAREVDLVIHEYDEQVDDQNLMEHLLTVYDHPEFRLEMDVLSSFAKTRQFGVTAEGLRQIARRVASRVGADPPAHFVALVILGSKLEFGLARLYSAYADREGASTVEIFRSVAAAADWLDDARGRPAGTTAAAVEHALGSS